MSWASTSLVRLVINYQPLNNFLADDEFWLSPQIYPVLASLHRKIFFKFVLKYEFWQLVINLVEWFKTIWCIPHKHCHSTIMPFSLKDAPSIFHKALRRKFQLKRCSSLMISFHITKISLIMVPFCHSFIKLWSLIVLCFPKEKCC